MKHIFRTVLPLLLIVGILMSMLVACKSKGPTTDPSDGDEQTGSSVDVTDSAGPLTDPSVSTVIGSVSSADAAFLTQLADIYEECSGVSGYEKNGTIVNYFPDADEIIAKGRGDVAIYGIYGWAKEYLDFYDDLSEIGFTCLRTTGSIANATYDSAIIDDTVMAAICNSGISVMTTMGLAICSSSNLTSTTDYFLGTTQSELTKVSRDECLDYFDVAGWIEANIDKTFALLDKYGPNGTFFQENPDLNYNPIRYVEVYNEPNFQYMLPIKTSSGDDYANHEAKTKMYVMLQICLYTAVKNRYGDDVKIVGFGAGGDSGLDLAFIEAALSMTDSDDLSYILNTAIFGDASRANEEHAGVKTYAGSATLREKMGLSVGDTVKIDVAGTMDVLSTHPYWKPSPFSQNSQGSSIPKYLSQIRSYLKKYGGEEAADMPIWYTECGWNLLSSDGGLASSGGNVTQLVQAIMEVQEYILGMRCGVDRITYMHMQDTDGCNYGIFNHLSSGSGDYSWRTACYAIQVLTHLMPNPRLVNVINEGADKSGNINYIYEFESDIGGENVIVAFTAEKAQTLYIPWSEDYALVTDMLGTTKIVAAVKGQIVLDGGAAMMYVRHVDNQTLIANGYLPSLDSAELNLASYAWCEKQEQF
jgi:hypothetical protein